MEYSIESAALFNPSIVIYPKQNNLEKGQTRVIFSSAPPAKGTSPRSFQKRPGRQGQFDLLESVSPFIGTPEIVLNATLTGSFSRPS